MSWSKLPLYRCVCARKSSQRPDGRREYRKNKATFHAVLPAPVRPPPATVLPLVPALGVGPHAPRCPPGAGLARAYRRRPTPAAGQPCRPPAGHRPAPPGTARTGGWGRAAGAARAAERCLKAAGAARGGLLGLGLIQTQ